MKVLFTFKLIAHTMYIQVDCTHYVHKKAKHAAGFVAAAL